MFGLEGLDALMTERLREWRTNGGMYVMRPDKMSVT